MEHHRLRTGSLPLRWAGMRVPEVLGLYELRMDDHAQRTVLPTRPSVHGYVLTTQKEPVPSFLRSNTPARTAQHVLIVLLDDLGFGVSPTRAGTGSHANRGSSRKRGP